MSQQLFRQIPAVDDLLIGPHGAALCEEFSRAELLRVVRERLDQVRQALGDGAELPDFSSPAFFAELRAQLLAGRMSSLVPTINASGIVIHTNLGRAPLAEEALEAIALVARGYSNLEFDLTRGKRGSRYRHVESLLTRITGAEAAVVVNNCAAAVVLVLAALAKDHEVIVSRGELIEIGGSFRMPDVIAQSGATMIEVGTTNRTSIDDYRRALSEQTRVILSTHTSNFKIIGFTSRPALTDLVAEAHKAGVAVVEDLGSGTLVDLEAFGLSGEPTVQQSITAGVDVLTCSGDKLLGGPQAGIILGSARYIDNIKRNPLLRALRIDKLSLAALEATLRLYLPPNDPLDKIPVLRMLSEDKREVARRANQLLRKIRTLGGITAELADDVSYAGGGALPMNAIPTKVIKLRSQSVAAGELAKRLRTGTPAVIGRVADDSFIIDLRTVLPQQIQVLVAALKTAIA